MAAQSHVKSVVATKRHRTNGMVSASGPFVYVTVMAPAYAWRAVELFRRSEPFDTDRLRYSAHSVRHRGRCCGGCNVTRRPVPAACRGKTVAAKTVAAKEPYPLEFLTAFERQR